VRRGFFAVPVTKLCSVFLQDMPNDGGGSSRHSPAFRMRLGLAAFSGKPRCAAMHLGRAGRANKPATDALYALALASLRLSAAAAGALPSPSLPGRRACCCGCCLPTAAAPACWHAGAAPSGALASLLPDIAGAAPLPSLSILAPRFLSAFLHMQKPLCRLTFPTWHPRFNGVDAVRCDLDGWRTSRRAHKREYNTSARAAAAVATLRLLLLAAR